MTDEAATTDDGSAAVGTRRPIRIANCSGFYGDRRSAAREMVDGGPIDVLTGDYLAELTMLILAKARSADGGVGYARTFLAQMRETLARCIADGTKVVTNAGGLDPAGCADALRRLADDLDLTVAVAHVEGDDVSDAVMQLDPPAIGPVASANAYLGGWGIARALDAGADVVVTGRVSDASLVVGPAAWWHGWAQDDWDALAGAVAAGHVIECGTQATGGNYPFLDEVEDRRAPGFPIAEVHADGSAVITKHPDTGGLVSVGTVTAQLLYEIASPSYLNPDVTARFDTVSLTQPAPGRVRITGTRGAPPPARLKVAVTATAGYRNTMTLVMTGLDIEQKARWAEQLLFDRLDRGRFDEVTVELLRTDRPDAPTNPQATAHLRITVKGEDERLVGRDFSAAVVEQALGSYAGFHATTPPTAASSFGVYAPASIARADVTHVVVLPDGTRAVVPPPTTAASPVVTPAAVSGPTVRGPVTPDATGTDTVTVPLGRIVGARSGDKGGDANLGLWVRNPSAYEWMRQTLTVERIRALVGPEAAGLAVDRYELPNLLAVNVVVHGLLGEGVASSTRPDPQAKGLGEYVRSRHVDVPATLLEP